MSPPVHTVRFSEHEFKFYASKMTLSTYSLREIPSLAAHRVIQPRHSASGSAMVVGLAGSLLPLLVTVQRGFRSTALKCSFLWEDNLTSADNGLKAHEAAEILHNWSRPILVTGNWWASSMLSPRWRTNMFS
jgi:hypothetical protein